MRAGNLIALVRTLEADHGPGGWPAVEMATLSALADEIERLRLLTFCGCGDQFTAHDPGTCGSCVAGMVVKP